MNTKTLIFMCAFYDRAQLYMLFRILESIYIYGNLDDNVDILIYTSSEFAAILQNSNLYCVRKIIIRTNDEYVSIHDAHKAKLDLFELGVANGYDRVLYLDNDVLFVGDINVLLCMTYKSDTIFAAKDGNIGDASSEWGRSLFDAAGIECPDEPAFSTSVMLFRTSSQIRALFSEVKHHIKTSPGLFLEKYDRPYIVFRAFIYDMYDTLFFSAYIHALLYDDKTSQMKILRSDIAIRFCGSIADKTYNMDLCLNALKRDRVNTVIEKTKEIITQKLIPVLQLCGEDAEGNLFVPSKNAVVDSGLYNTKLYNIGGLCINANVIRVLEIGFNSGFSALFMLMCNPFLCITCVDICSHIYTRQCYMVLKDIFGDRIQLIEGDSVTAMHSVDGTFDLIHIDGSHDEFIAASDIIHAYRLSRTGTVIIMDDYNHTHLGEIWGRYCNMYSLKSVDTKILHTPYHDIKMVSR
jgi:hypothetical protein